MSAASLWKYAYLAHFSQPKFERELYRLVRRRRTTRIVELGIGNAARGLRLIQVAQRYTDQRVEYTGVDLFEARPRGDGLTLIAAHRRLKPSGAKVRLLPGDPLQALAAFANSLPATDLMLISADQDEQALAEAWFYVPRMLQPDSVVLQERTTATGTELARLPLLEIQRMAARPRAYRRAA